MKERDHGVIAENSGLNPRPEFSGLYPVEPAVEQSKKKSRTSGISVSP